jgi:hypothetical protein
LESNVLGKITRNPVILGRQLFRHGKQKKRYFFAALFMLQEGGGMNRPSDCWNCPFQARLEAVLGHQEDPQLSIYSWKDK